MDTVDFCNATSVWNYNEFGVETAWVAEPENVIETREKKRKCVFDGCRGYPLLVF